MDKLFLFFKRKVIFFEFLLLEAVAFLLIMQNDSYQGNKLLASFNHWAAVIYSETVAIEEYFYLIPKNHELAEENAMLQEQIEGLEQMVMELKQRGDSLPNATGVYSFIPAEIVYNSVTGFQNYMVINKGIIDGVSPEMGVVERNGVVGIVRSVSQHFATVLPLLNVQSRLSCRIGQEGNLGTLLWDAHDSRFAKLEEVPNHVGVNVGDSIFTSGLSAIFPKGFLVGVVEQAHLEKNAANYDITVRLACDFRTVSYVKIVSYAKRKELDEAITEIKK